MFFDVTCSTQSGEVREETYGSTLGNLSEDLGRRDRLQQIRVSTIDHATFLNPTWEVSIASEPYRPSNESELGFEERVKRTRASLHQEVETLLSESLSQRPPRCRSDVLGAFSKASATYSAPGEGLSSASRHLVLFSDMAQFTDELSFRRRTGLDLKDPEAVDRFIEERRNSNLLPNLQGVSVQVFAPGLNVGRTITARKQQLIQSFWTKYVTAAGGRVTVYGTQPRLP